MNNRLDKFWLGSLFGLIAPSIGILLFYLTNYSLQDMSSFLELAVKEKMLSPLLSLCVVINLGVFYLFIHFEKYYSARGVIFSTFIYGLAIVILKFFY
ncbi:MAG: hypothetical protein NTU43_12500 [Bacteroidetes bacterium]|nr:hypothetical protein [Bacteroidota bacterium]